MKKITPYICVILLAIVYLVCSKATNLVSATGLAESQAGHFATAHTVAGGGYNKYHTSYSPVNHLFLRNIWEIGAYTYEQIEEPQIKQSSEIDPSKPMIALTFDDGPGIHTARILDLLEQYGARATFCIIGGFAEPRRGLVARAFESGNEIIGHSWSHRSLTKLTSKEIKQEIMDTHAAIESIIGTAPKMYRVPYGAINDKVRQISKELGFSIIGWSVDPRDWELRDADLVYNAIMDSATDGAIVICHDTYESTAEAIERIIPELITQGYQLVTVSELFKHRNITLEPGEVYHRAAPTCQHISP